jgi:transmembrane sensor
VHDDAADLMLAADAARLSGHPAEAVRPLRAVCDRHGGDRRAPVAAFTLGRVLLDELGQPAEAAAAFRKASALWPSGPLAEDALSREADAWQQAGRVDDSRAAAGKYLARFPKGRHVEAMRKILAL